MHGETVCVCGGWGGGGTEIIS